MALSTESSALSFDVDPQGAFDGIVPVATFMAAQEILAERSKKLTDAELLDHLKVKLPKRWPK